MSAPETTPPSRYPIRSVADFMTVPLDRLSDCLEEFASWLAVHHAVLLTLPPGTIKNDATAEFCWIDDGLREGRVTFANLAGEVLLERVIALGEPQP